MTTVTPLGQVATSHGPTPSGFCDVCGTVWPCSTARRTAAVAGERAPA